MKIAEKKRNHKRSFNAMSIVLMTLLVIYAVALFSPLIWGVITAFMDTESYATFYAFMYFDQMEGFFPTSLFDNFKIAWRLCYIQVNGIFIKDYQGRIVNVIGLFVNSLMYAFLCAFFNTLCPTIVGYATGRFRFRSSKIIYGFVVVAMSLPIVGSMSSELRMLSIFGLRGKMSGMAVLKFNFLSVYYLILYEIFKAIPADYSEAAKIDGANNLVIMFRIIIPQAANMIFTIFILTFITYWNDLQVPLVYIPDYPLVTQLLYELSQAGTMKNGQMVTMPLQLAAAIILASPIIILFCVFSKKLRISVAMGGIKG